MYMYVGVEGELHVFVCTLLFQINLCVLFLGGEGEGVKHLYLCTYLVYEQKGALLNV